MTEGSETFKILVCGFFFLVLPTGVEESKLVVDDPAAIVVV